MVILERQFLLQKKFNTIYVAIGIDHALEQVNKELKIMVHLYQFVRHENRLC